MTRTHLLIQVFFLQFLIIKGQFNATFGFINVGPGTGTLDPGPYPQQTGLLFAPFRAIGVSPQPSASGRFAYSNWPLGALNGQDDFLSFTGDLSGLAYYEAKILVLSGYALDLNSVSFNVRRSGTGIRNYSIKSSSDNFNTNLSASTGTNSNIQVLPGNIFFWKFDSLSTANDQKGSAVSVLKRVTDSITFRFYAWNAEATGGSFSIDNVTFSGKIIDLNNPEAIFEIRNSNLSDGIYFDAEKKIICNISQQFCNWTVYNMQAKIVREEESCTFIGIQDLETGIYLIKCNQEERITWKKIMVCNY